MGRGLSQLQRHVLGWLWAYHAFADPHWGLPYRKLTHPGRETRDRAAAAALSRAVRRLEDRGLVLRRNVLSGDRHEPPGQRERSARIRADMGMATHRSTHIQLTTAGEVVARSLENG